VPGTASLEEEWPPPVARLRSAIWRAEGHIERGEYFAASDALADVFDIAGRDAEYVRGLHHLAAAGYKHLHGNPLSARRQLAHARRRLTAFPRAAELIALVERQIGS
jgi:predicted metal-dependent hydrolase